MDYPINTSIQLRAVLRALRKLRNLSQAELGVMLGVNQKRVARIEIAPGQTNFDQIAKIVTVLGGRLVIAAEGVEPEATMAKGKTRRKTAGLFIYEVMVAQMGHFSGLAGAVSLAVIAIPVVVRTTEDMLLLVPNHLREAASALGAPRSIMIRNGFSLRLAGRSHYPFLLHLETSPTAARLCPTSSITFCPIASRSVHGYEQSLALLQRMRSTFLQRSAATASAPYNSFLKEKSRSASIGSRPYH